MKTLEWFMKRKEEADQELAKLAGNLDKLNENRQTLEEQIASAIDEEKLSVVEKLTAQESELDNRIRAAEKILARRKEKNTFDREELAAAWNDELQKYQDGYNSVMDEAVGIKMQYFKKLLEAAKIAREGRDKRIQYLKFAGDKNPARQEPSNRDFKTIKTAFINQFTPDEVDMLRSIDPNAVTIIRTT